MILNKSEVAEILGIDEDNIPDKLITWAELQIKSLLNINLEETSFTYEELILKDTVLIRLPKGNIKSIDKIYLDGEEQSWTEGVNYKINKTSGLIYLTSGISAGRHLKIEYTVKAYSNSLIEFLFVLLVLKGLGIFSPETAGLVNSVRIGRFAKTYGSYENIQENLDKYIDDLINQIKGNKGIEFDTIR